MRALDTNVLVYFLGGDRRVAGEMERWEVEGDTLFVSTLVEAELLSLPRLTLPEIARVEELLETMVRVPVDIHVARIAAAFRRQYRTKLADAIIAATAFLRDVPLATRNIRDFRRIREIRVEEI